MIDTDHDKFFFALSQLKACFPGFCPSEPGWRDMAGVYFAKLRDLDVDSVVSVVDALAKTNNNGRKFFPTLAELRGAAILDAEQRRRRAKLPQDIGPPLPRRETRLASDHPAMLLAYRWERESRELGLDPERPSPPEIAKRRFVELHELVDKLQVGGAI